MLLGLSLLLALAVLLGRCDGSFEEVLFALIKAAIFKFVFYFLLFLEKLIFVALALVVGVFETLLLFDYCFVVLSQCLVHLEQQVRFAFGVGVHRLGTRGRCSQLRY